MQNNAIENVKNSLDQLNQAKAKLQSAVGTVEKAENKNLIQNSLDSVANTIKQVESTISNYKES
ncbi:hypothetical protein BH721_08650 [Clostridium baratii]|uniref:Uncharacterized protein n=1 Tax=Clostridium baratii TaxID=1561 RepID=A0A174UPQ4_9CLOT|nr:hypothetical protein [Clostridium baratii]OPF53036.1 hypothetical protein A1M12_00680 [Clostridium baratii]OPF53743.1 hypothetical protein BH721_08650 [Clostridium baratii]OPF54407.1 hypothetical protein BH724_02480 [Clostridium baratii]OPF60879.1 hypothetical protein BH725_01150 [Clostridium baratii]CUQ20959.1 Uncharacterised protein [Clostridium baratii]